MTIVEWATVLGTVGGAILTLHLVVTRLVWKPVKNALIEEVKKELDSRLAPIAEVVAQLRPNGGSHLADRIIRLEERQSGISQRLDDLYDLVKSMKESK